MAGSVASPPAAIARPGRWRERRGPRSSGSGRATRERRRRGTPLAAPSTAPPRGSPIAQAPTSNDHAQRVWRVHAPAVRPRPGRQFGRQAPGPAARLRRRRNEYRRVGSLECLLDLEVRPQTPDRAIKPGLGSATGAADDRRDLLEREVEVEVKDDDEAILVVELGQRPA